MKRTLIISFLMLVFSSFLITCNSLNDSETATVTIDTGIRATKAAAPSDVTSISVTVSGSSMTTMMRAIPISTGVRTFEVPVGPARLFSVTATGSSFPYIGSATRDIPETGEVNISITMVRQIVTLNLDISSFYNNSPISPYVTDYTVTITESDTTNSYTTTVPASDILMIYVSPGTLDIAVSPNINASANQSAVTAASGSVSGTFVLGETRNINVDVHVTETKIVIPDYNFDDGSNVGRIVQIDDINGNGWIARSAITGIANFRPYDIDFDSLGRIYIANNYGSTGDDVVISIDRINGSDITAFGSNGSGYDAIAIDRINNYIYSARSGVNTLWRSNLDGSNFVQITLTGVNFNDIRGLAVDDSGNLYIAAHAGTVGSLPYVFKYEPSTTNVSSYTTGLDTPWDVLVKDNYLYLTNLDGAGSDNQIIQLNMSDLSFVASYGNQADNANTDPGMFYGPRTFLAILNEKITLIDDHSSNDLDKLVSMDDLYDGGWETYPTSGDGQDLFMFYDYYTGT